MSSTITNRLDEDQDPQDGAPAWRGASPEGERSDALALRAADHPRLAGARAEVKALLPDELIDELLAGARTEEEIAGQAGCWRS